MIDRVQVHRLPDGSLTASFVYNAEGLRVQKAVNGVVTKYMGYIIVKGLGGQPATVWSMVLP